ncbi:hypothetical protein V493_06266, partial [Pseudogymnoascus sp. VKM F-4281 (FW-2241)]
SSRPAHYHADFLPTHACLLGQKLLDIQALPNPDLPLVHPLEHRLQLAHHTLGAILHAPEDLCVGVGADKGEESRDSDAAADEEEPVALKYCRGAVVRRGEIRVRVAARRRRPAHALDVYPDDASADLDDLCAADSHLGDAQDADQAVGEPHSARGVDPHLVTPLAVEEELDVVPAPNEHEDGEHDVKDEEPFVGLAAHVQRADDEHDAHGERGDDAPDPVLQHRLLGERALLDVQDELEDRVQDGLEREDARHPPVQQEDDEGREREGEHARARSREGEDFEVGAGEPEVGLLRGVAYAGEDDVQHEEEEDPPCLDAKWRAHRVHAPGQRRQERGIPRATLGARRRRRRAVAHADAVVLVPRAGERHGGDGGTARERAGRIIHLDAVADEGRCGGQGNRQGEKGGETHGRRKAAEEEVLLKLETEMVCRLAAAGNSATVVAAN